MSCESNDTPFVMIQHLYQELFGDNQGSVSTAHLYENPHVQYLQSAKLFIFPMLGFLGTFSMSFYGLHRKAPWKNKNCCNLFPDWP